MTSVLYKVTFCLSLICLICFVAISCYVNSIPRPLVYNTNLSHASNGTFPHAVVKPHPLILYWGLPWGKESGVPKENSSMGECVSSIDKARLNEADVVVFHFTVVDHNMIPWRHYRSPNQVFVWWSAESPPSVAPSHYRPFDGFFNWTWTYRYDADVHRGYGYRSNALRMPRGQKVVDEIVAGKKTLAVWFVSNCMLTRGARERMAYADDLVKAGLKVEMFGKCFGNENLFPRSNGGEVKRKISEAKFYFAFENARHCKDYITEKFWDTALGNGAVPVVWGPAKDDVTRVAPLGSFIHVDDFASPEKLAHYLEYLDRNPSEYRKYFRWREQEDMSDEKMIALVERKYPGVKPHPTPKSLCEVYLANRGKRKTIKSLESEFVFSNSPECYQ